jgi:TRAP-type C4-dicarboxylate transport system substrate-binding protein
MSLKVYKTLPQNVKDVITQMRREFPKKSVQLVMEGDKATVAAAQKAGVGFYKFTPEEVAEWKKRVNYDALQEQWIQTRTQRSHADVAGFFAEFRKAVLKHDAESIYKQDFPKASN